MIASDNQGQQLTIEKINNVITVLGKNAFEQHLKKGNKRALAADRFAQIVKTVLEKQTDQVRVLKQHFENNPNNV